LIFNKTLIGSCSRESAVDCGQVGTCMHTYVTKAKRPVIYHAVISSL